MLTHLVRMILNGELDVFSLRVTEVVDQVIEQILCPDSPYDTDDASGQMVLCATIIRTKSRRLLPVEEDSAPEEDAAEAAMLEEERTLRSLLEYQHFQAVAGVLSEMAEESAKLFPRGNKEVPEGDDRQDLSHVSLLSLVAALEKALDNRDPEPLSIDTHGYSMHEGLSHLRTALASGKRMVFSDIFPRGAGRLVIVVVFLGLLELIRTGEVKVNERDGRIYIRKEGAVHA
ncbi:MAG TPA: segregation/condensation protein A [Bacillota bacterium]|nr:segregation/condensation protein A [Bacillota bacterium]